MSREVLTTRYPAGPELPKLQAHSHRRTGFCAGHSESTLEFPDHSWTWILHKQHTTDGELGALRENEYQNGVSASGTDRANAPHTAFAIRMALELIGGRLSKSVDGERSC